MALCGNAHELLRELQRSDWLPPYNDDVVRQVNEEVQTLFAQITEKLRVFGDDLEQHSTVHSGLVITHQCLLRNKRCILAYLNHRLEKIKKLRWETGTIIPAPLVSMLAPQEIQFFHAYDQLLTDYMTNFDLDLAADINPPKNLYVEIRVIHPIGDVMTENGIIQLEQNSTHFLRRVDVEHLIRQGHLEQIRR